MLLEDIYQGKVFLQEMVSPKHEGYKELISEKYNLEKKLKEFLSEEQIKLFNKYSNVVFDIEEKHAMSAFVEGVKFGANMYKEII